MRIQLRFVTMSLEEEHDTAAGEMQDNETSQSDGYNLAMETGLCCQAKEMTENENCDRSEHRSSYILSEELEENDKQNNGQEAESEELNINKKLAMLQNVFKTVGGDLEDIKTLMLRLREILNNGYRRENCVDLNRNERPCSSGESSTDREVIVIDDDDDKDPMQQSPPSQGQASLAGPTRESSLDCIDDSKYSTLVADIEILKNKLVALKRNLAE